MNTRDATVRPTEMVASPLESFGGQPHATETYAKARELRKWIAGHPGKRAVEMPPDLRGYVEFLMRKKLVYWKNNDARQRVYFVRPL